MILYGESLGDWGIVLCLASSEGGWDDGWRETAAVIRASHVTRTTLP